jgi:hypothetical protein
LPVLERAASLLERRWREHPLDQQKVRVSLRAHGRSESSPADVRSTRASELLFDLTVRGRIGRKLFEGCVEEAVRVFVSALAAADQGEVCDHLSLVFLVAERAKEDERLLEVPDCCRHAAFGMNESESEVVECQRLGTAVTERTHDRKRCTMLLGCLFALAFTPKLRPELIESKGFAVRVDSGRFPLTMLQERASPMRSDVCAALQALLKAAFFEPPLERPGSPLDRHEGYRQPLSQSEAAQEQEPSRHGARDEQEGDGSEQDDAESDCRQHSGQQEPESGERENAAAQLLPID